MNIAVIFAGGTGQRMRTKDLPKQFLMLHEKPIIVYTLEHFEKHKDIDAIVVVCVEGWQDYLKDILYKFRIEKVCKVVTGGATGQESIYNGLCAARDEVLSRGEQLDNSVVLIHDGVRPMINEKLITDNIQSVLKNGSAITTAKVTETILVVDESEAINQVPERSKSRVAKAPQSFMLQDILAAHEKANKEGIHDFIDSCTMMKYYGYSLHLVDGPGENIKITTPNDFYTLRAYLDSRENEQLYVDVND